MTIQYWVVDIYNRTGPTQPKLAAQTLEFPAALRVVEMAKIRGESDIIKVRAPLDASWSEIEQFLNLGAEVSSGP
jgi:hypothetical protein